MDKNKGLFEDLLKQPGDPRWLDDIRKDLHRQFPMHEMFTDPDGPGYVSYVFACIYIRLSSSSYLLFGFPGRESFSASLKLTLY